MIPAGARLCRVPEVNVHDRMGGIQSSISRYNGSYAFDSPCGPAAVPPGGQLIFLSCEQRGGLTSNNDA
jgi:hypothetical protein